MTLNEIEAYIYAASQAGHAEAMKNAMACLRTYAYFRRSNDDKPAPWFFLTEGADVPAGAELAWPEAINGTPQQTANLFRLRCGRMPLLPAIEGARQ